ncbi:MAG TPA: cohesin domain-containing protein [Bacteroidales bacterium]|nr:cohesin domain-containing protein [Bacteroidales bacterium]
MKKIIANSLILLLVSFSLRANVTLLTGHHTVAEGSQVIVPVRAVDFINIVSAQGTIQFDPSILSFVSVQDFGFGSLSAGNFGTSQAANGKLMFMWTDPDLGGESLPDSAVLFTIRFNSIGTSGQSSTLTFVNLPTVMEVINNSFNPETLNLIAGSVTIQNLVQPHAVILKFDSVSGVHGSQLIVSCRVYDFSNINSVQGTIVFDNSVVSFEGVGFCGMPGLNASSFGLSQLSQGKITFSWTDAEFLGQDLADGDALFSLHFLLTGSAGQHAVITFVDTPTPVEVSDSSLNILPAGTIGGDIAITGASQVFEIKIDSVNASTGFLVSVPVRVWQFNKIISLQGTVTFDPSHAVFISTEQYGLPGMDSTNFGTTLASQGKLMFMWTDATASGQNLNDSSVLFAIKFLVTASLGSSPYLDFSNAPTPIEITDTSQGEISFNTHYGKISVLGGGYKLSGKTKYGARAYAGNPVPSMPTYSSLKYNISQVIVKLKSYPGGLELARDTSNTWGTYGFNNVPDGTYLLSYDKYTADTMQMGNDINAIDVAFLKYLVGHDTLQDPSRNFSRRHKKAADVDNNTLFNALDIARLKAKVGQPYSPTANFSKGNWPAADTLVTIAGHDLIVNLTTIGYGDYDASSSKYKDSANNWNMAKSSATANIIYQSTEILTVNKGACFEIPLKILSKISDFSAMGLELNYPATYFKLVSASMPKGNKKTFAKINPSFEEIVAEDNDLLVTDADGVIRVVYATTGFYDVAAGDEILVLGFKPLQEMPQGDTEFYLDGTGIMADQYGRENENTGLSMPKIFFQGNYEEKNLEFSGFPNPMNGNTVLTFETPEDASVKLSLYNARGEKIDELLNKPLAGGKHTMPFFYSQLPSGLYLFTLDITTSTNSYRLTLKMIR